MRKLSELYKVVLSEYNIDSDFYLCNHIDSCIQRGLFSLEESGEVSKHFAEQRPTEVNHPTFYAHPLCNKDIKREVWFRGDYKSEEGTQVRREFLSSLIKICKSEEWAVADFIEIKADDLLVETAFYLWLEEQDKLGVVITNFIPTIRKYTGFVETPFKGRSDGQAHKNVFEVFWLHKHTKNKE